MSLEIIIGILGLVFTGITSIAGIKYILSSWKIRKLARQFKKKNVDKDYLQKIALDVSYRNSARAIIERNPIMNALDGFKRVFEDIERQLWDLNITLQRFSNYNKPEFPKDFVSKMNDNQEKSKENSKKRE